MTAKKIAYDKTSTRRQEAHLSRLVKSKGKRKVIDLDGEHVVKLAELRAAGFGTTDADVFRRLLDEAHERLNESD